MVLRLVPTKAAPADVALLRALDALIAANEELSRATREDLCVGAIERWSSALEVISTTPAATTTGLLCQARGLLESVDRDREGNLLAVDEAVAAALASGVLRLLSPEQRP